MTSYAYPKTNWRDIIEASETASKGADALTNRDLLQPADRFVKRHIGPRSKDVTHMLHTLGLASLDELIEEAVPANIRMQGHLDLERPRSESAVLRDIRHLAEQNKVYRSFIGVG
jgi:glycine dehydrogenase